ncbi:MAG TPA: Fe-S cluster assembly protein SufD [Trebonia sp.]|jgi:Fe-S cluster assembly protein SufD|nr:Fe-S cluster assembly protein SufD [Trebonia sp.]
MSSLSGAVETAPVTSLHALRSVNPDDFPVPTGREEEWRFTPLSRLRGLHKNAPLGSTGVQVSVEPAPEIDYTERTVAPAESAFLPDDRVSARAFAAAGIATVITVPKEAVASRPTIVRVTGTGAAVAGGDTTGRPAESGVPATAGHIIIDVQPFGKAVVVIDQRGNATYADNVEISVADGGDLTLVWIADWADDAAQVSHHQATLGRDARLKHFAITLGGSLVRLSPIVRYAAPGGDAELYGICFADAGQHLEHRLFVDHDTPNCRSRVVYKGALSGEDAHTVWIGDVLIRPEATGTDTYEYNRNLVLTDGARADSVPNLEILTGEVVGAGHASANGRLDDEHIFYLMARGIPENEARRLVIRGFFGELISRIGVPEVEERVIERIEAELAGSMA